MKKKVSNREKNILDEIIKEKIKIESKILDHQNKQYLFFREDTIPKKITRDLRGKELQ